MGFFKNLFGSKPPNVEVHLEALADKDEEVRTKAIVSLVKIGQPAVEPLIAYILKLNAFDKPYQRKSAFKALIEIGQPSIEPLLGLLTEDNRDVTLGAVNALKKSGWKPGNDLPSAQYWAVNYLYSPFPKTAAEALKVIGWEPDESETAAAYWIARRKWDACVKIGPPAVRPLFITLQDLNQKVRQSAAKALVKIGQPAAEPLIDLLNTSYRYARTEASWLDLRVNGAQVLGEMGDPLAVEPLIKMGCERVFTKDPKRAAPDMVWVDPSSGRKKYETWDHRYAAAEALAKIGKPAVEPVLDLLGKNAADHRHMGAVTLGKLGDMRAVKPLIGLLSSTYHDKPAAREALESITGQNFRFDKNKWLAWLEKQDAAVESAAV